MVPNMDFFHHGLTAPYLKPVMNYGLEMVALDMERKTYPGDVSDDEWAFVAPYLTLMTEDAPQRGMPVRARQPGHTTQISLPLVGMQRSHPLADQPQPECGI